MGATAKPQDRFDVARFGAGRHPRRDGSDDELDDERTNVLRAFVHLSWFHQHHRHKGRQPIARQWEAALSRSPDPVPKMLRNEVMASRHAGNHRTRCDRLATIRPLASSLHRRRRATPVTSPRRLNIFVSSLMSTIMSTPSAIPTESPSCVPPSRSAMCGQSPAYSASERSREDVRHGCACRLFSRGTPSLVPTR
jgi:hypothetical protein